jgi:predicted membrane channel-forming protein YqfA (hemolysin III family)
MLQLFPVKFNNPLWHLLVLIAGAMQYVAISLQLTGGVF